MCVCVCVCVCVYVCMYVYIYICVCVCSYVYIYTYIACTAETGDLCASWARSSLSQPDIGHYAILLLITLYCV